MRAKIRTAKRIIELEFSICRKSSPSLTAKRTDQQSELLNYAHDQIIRERIAFAFPYSKRTFSSTRRTARIFENAENPPSVTQLLVPDSHRYFGTC